MKKVVVITGPTGVGKTKYSIELAKKFNSEIINADASQIFKKLDIGTAKIKPEDMNGVKHHLFNILEPEEEFSIKEYQALARKLIKEINLPFLVGGSGLYIKSVITDYKLDHSPRIKNEYLDYSNEELHDLLASLDQEAANKIHPNNRRRVIRYIDIANEKGKVKPPTPLPLYDTLTLCLTRERKILYDRINERCDEMFAEGWIEECQNLLNDGVNLNKLKDIGYRDIGLYLDGNLSFEQLREKIKQQQRHYAKRQMTWFRNQMDCVFIDLDINTFQDIENIITDFLKD